MPDTKISAGADPGTLVATDRVPMARSASTTAYAATMAELAVYANTAYVPNYATGSPSMDGTPSAGTASTVSRGDHKHPSDTSMLPMNGSVPMTGLLTLSGDPTATLHAATKQYVDGLAPVGGPYVAIANMHDVGRNLVMNPLFNIAQRGTGPWTVGGYTLDRWFVSTTDTTSIAQGIMPDSVRVQIGDEAAYNYLGNTFTGSAGAGAYIIVAQFIEGVRRLAGKTVTISFWAGAAATPRLGINIVQNFGTGGSPSATLRALATGNNVQLSTVMSRYSTTIAIPSVSGKTLGTAGNDYTALELWYSSGATNNAISGNIGVQSGTINLWGVQLEIGSVATPLEKPDPQQDLAKCQRFFVGTSQVIQFMFTSWGAGAAANRPVTFPVQMRATPTVVMGANSANTNATAATTANASPLGFDWQITSGAASGGATALNATGYTASADL